LSPSKTLHTPKGFSALSFVQEGTLLLNGHNLLALYLSASGEKLFVGKPNTSEGDVLALLYLLPVLTFVVLLIIIVSYLSSHKGAACEKQRRSAQAASNMVELSCLALVFFMDARLIV
jgi:hypothetical protein